MKPLKVVPKARPTVDDKFVPTASAEQLAGRETAIRAAMIESMANLSLDEQYIVGLVLAELRELSKVQMGPRYHGIEVRLSPAAFARRCLVGNAEASARLKAAAHSLFDRTFRASYPSENGRGNEKYGACWFESLGTLENEITLRAEITLRLGGEAMNRVLMAMAVAPEAVEESASMIGDLLGATEVIAAVVVRRTVRTADQPHGEAECRSSPPLILSGYNPLP